MGRKVHPPQHGVGKTGNSASNFERECTIHTQIGREIPVWRKPSRAGAWGGKQACWKENKWILETSLVSVKHTSKTDMFLQTGLVRSACHDGKSYR